jgi:hypothetical protein
MVKKIFFLSVGFISLTLLTEEMYCQETLKQGYGHPHYDLLWPYEIEFNMGFSIPDSIISSDSGEIRVGFQYDIPKNIYNIYIYSIVLKRNDDIVYDYNASVFNEEDGTWHRQDKDLMFYRISNVIHEYIYNEIKLIRNERPFFRERYYPSISISF